VARDRKRAKQRRERRAAAASSRASSAERGANAAPNQPIRANVPGSLDHASGEADEFEAALVRGAGGMPAAPEELDELEQTDAPSDLEAPAETGLEDGPAVADDEQALAPPPAPPGGDGGVPGGGAPAGERPAGAPLQGGNRAVAFLRASWAELQRVQWPDRRQVTQATAVVIGFVAIAGAYLGVADYIAKEIVEFVL
jgi:preprotein translocase SecE subunit